MDLFVGILLGSLCAIGGVFAYGRIEFWKGRYETVVEQTEELNNALSLMTTTAQTYKEKFKMIEEFTRQVLERPVVAALKEEHIAAISQTLMTLVAPNRVN